MTLATRPFSTQPERSAWQKPHIRDAVLCLVFALFTYAAAHVFELPPHLLQFGLDHPDWEVDDLIFVVFIVSAAVIIYGVRRYREVVRENAARIKAEEEAGKLARHDPLTGLPNRRFFEERLNEVLRTVVAGRQLAVLMLDLDGFKPINDIHGHAAGDKALSEFARRVSAVLGRDTFFARIGGDEFAILMPAIASVEDAADLAARIQETVAEPFVVGHATVRRGVGVGIAVAPDNGMRVSQLVRRADRALYRAKATRNSSMRFFKPEMDEVADRRVQIERELRIAVSADLLVPHFQPITTLDGDRVIGFEALARWENASLGLISPDAFIPVAEETGLIVPLGDQLLRRACLEAKSWPQDFTLSFNISGVQLHDPTFGLRVLTILAQTGLDPRQLELEITETALVANIAIARNIVDQLRQAGVRVALDDFGTGYTAMAELLSLNLDKIKIDRSFVSCLGESEESRAIVRAILSLARDFGLRVTAEGVEDRHQLAYLKENGCEEGQGYLFGRPIPAGEIPAFLESRPCSSAVA